MKRTNLKTRRHSADELIDLAAVLENHESGHLCVGGRCLDIIADWVEIED